jgi:hypothetical protein
MDKEQWLQLPIGGEIGFLISSIHNRIFYNKICLSIEFWVVSWIGTCIKTLLTHTFNEIINTKYSVIHMPKHDFYDFTWTITFLKIYVIYDCTIMQSNQTCFHH